MKLLVDIGNSRLKWAQAQGQELKFFGSCDYRDPSVWAGFFKAIQRPDSVYLASVVTEEINREFQKQVLEQWGLVVTTLQSESRCCGVHSAYHEANTMGVDRWAALIAAHHQFHSATIVVDCGSAMTVDALDAGGGHRGGYILPGIQMQHRALSHGTAGIELTETDHHVKGWGTDTASCIRRGVIEAMAALVERSAKQLSEELQAKVDVVITGGDASQLIPILPVPSVYREHLVLEGIAIMANAEKG
jgi:type III pantothenate kinase